MIYKVIDYFKTNNDKRILLAVIVFAIACFVFFQAGKRAGEFLYVITQ